MEKLTNVADYLRWVVGYKRKTDKQKQQQNIIVIDNNNDDDDDDNNEGLNNKCMKKHNNKDAETFRRLFDILESILLWENSLNSLSVVIVFNILFWSIVVLEVRGFAAASSAALVVVLCYSTLEAQVETESQITTSPKTERIGKIITKAKSSFESIKLLRKHQPGLFCAGVCFVSILLWMVGRAINGVVLAYAMCMSILLGPALLMKIPSKSFFSKEWESEMEEFLPIVTDDNLELLQRVGETGDHSPIPTSRSSDNQIDCFNDEELIGLKMPSHEDGSTDGLELSELELSSGEADVDGLKIKSGHFKGNLSSSSSSSCDDEDGERLKLSLKSKDLLSHSVDNIDDDDDDDDDNDDNDDVDDDDNDSENESEFEIVDINHFEKI